MNELIKVDGARGAFTEFFIIEKFVVTQTNSKDRIIKYPPFIMDCYPFKYIFSGSKTTKRGTDQYRRITKIDVSMANLTRHIHDVYSKNKKVKPYLGNLEKYHEGSVAKYIYRGSLFNAITKIKAKAIPYGVVERHLMSKEYPMQFVKDYERFVQICPEKFLNKEIFKPELVLGSEQNVEIHIMHIQTQALAWLQVKKELPLFTKAIQEGIKSKENIDFDKYIEDWARRLIDEVFVENN